MMLIAVATPIYAMKIEATGGVEAGYRRDSLDWNIADVDGSPNVLSELRWGSLQTLELKAHVSLNVERLVIMGDAYLGDYYKGTNRDSDYFGDNRTGEFSRSVNDADGATWGSTLGLGLRLPIRELIPPHQPELVLTPMVGFSYFEQQLNMFNGYQVIPASGSFPDLYSEYNTQWRMPWASVKLEATDYFDRTFEIGATLYRYGYFDADANWNLREEFAHPVSFRHHSRAYGYGWHAGVRVPMQNGLNLTVRFEQRMFTTEPGRDVTYLADGTSDETGLNEVNWDALTLLRVGIELRR